MKPPTAPTIVCHVLLVETVNGLVLVDAGYGLRDIAEPGRRIGVTRHLLRPLFRREETAAHQVEELGFRIDDVRHIVATHFDIDHIGGIADFPKAQIHITADEAVGAFRSPTRAERTRFRSAQWEHGPHIVEHNPDGERWRGFAAAKELDEIAPGIVLVSLPGHSRGHACVAVDSDHGWLLHCGDAFYHRGTLDGAPVPRGLALSEMTIAFDRAKVRENHRRLRELYLRGEPDLFVFSAHDADLYRKALSLGA